MVGIGTVASEPCWLLRVCTHCCGRKDLGEICCTASSPHPWPDASSASAENVCMYTHTHKISFNQALGAKKHSQVGPRRGRGTAPRHAGHQNLAAAAACCSWGCRACTALCMDLFTAMNR